MILVLYLFLFYFMNIIYDFDKVNKSFFFSVKMLKNMHYIELSCDIKVSVKNVSFYFIFINKQIKKLFCLTNYLALFY